MLKRGLIILCSICYCLYANSQNLVINPSFEDTIQFSNGQPDLIGWDNNLGSPDYFTSNYLAPFKMFFVPDNIRGSEIAQEGVAYMGIAFDFRAFEFREYLQFELLDTLEKDKLYKISFYLSLADSFELAVNWKDIGLVFQDSLLPNNLNHRLRLLSPVNYSDSNWDASSKLGWHKFELDYVANGNESVALIGCFKSNNDIQIDTVRNGGSNTFFENGAYYYIDDINISLSVGLVEESSPPRVKIYPNPAMHTIYFEFEEIKYMNSKVQLYDIKGQLVVNNRPTSSKFFKVDVSHLEEGVYLYRILNENNVFSRGKFIIRR